MEASPIPTDSALLAALPRVETALTPAEIGQRLARLAKRGKLPNHVERAVDAFSCDLFGEPLDFEMSGSLKRDGERTSITCTARIKPRTPIVFWLIAALTIQPGMWMTDSMIRTYITSYDIPTWWWYLPLTVLPIPFVWIRMLSRSRRAALEHAHELIERIRAEVDGTVGS